MKRAPVDSSSIATVGYDPASRTLEIEFRDGDVYQYFNVPAGISAAAVTPVLAVNYLIKAQAEAAKNVLATVGKYTIGRNEWGLYVTDGEVKAKFKPDCTEEQARTTTAEQAAEMIKSYKAWKKKNAGRK